MTNVTARKIRDHGRERPAVGVGRVYNGFLVSYPVVGRGMVIFRDPNGHRMITTPVKLVLADPEHIRVGMGGRRERWGPQGNYTDPRRFCYDVVLRHGIVLGAEPFSS